MKIQTLIVTTGQTDHSLLERMNVQTDALVGNQCDRNEIEEFVHNGNNIRWFSMRERGVGLNRNTVMMRADADICVFADDDMVFHDGYADAVAKLFEQYPNADILLFNIDEKDSRRYKNTEVISVGRKNYGRYGAARLAFRTERVRMAGISFHLMFGGGAKFSNGEDSIFLHDCLKHGLKMLAVPVAIAELHEIRESTWFTGYDDNFFYGKGILYAHVYGKFAHLIALYNCLRHRNGLYRAYGWKNAYRRACAGIRSLR